MLNSSCVCELYCSNRVCLEKKFHYCLPFFSFQSSFMLLRVSFTVLFRIAQDIFWNLHKNNYVCQDSIDQLLCENCNRLVLFYICLKNIFQSEYFLPSAHCSNGLSVCLHHRDLHLWRSLCVNATCESSFIPHRRLHWEIITHTQFIQWFSCKCKSSFRYIHTTYFSTSQS